MKPFCRNRWKKRMAHEGIFLQHSMFARGWVAIFVGQICISQGEGLLLCLLDVTPRSLQSLFLTCCAFPCLTLSISYWPFFANDPSTTNIQVSLRSIMQLKDFQMQIANSLMLRGKSNAPKRGRPSLTIERPKTNAAVSIPPKDVVKDQVGHFPIYDLKQNRCRFCPKGYTKVQCTKCKINLCFTGDKNCFYDFHN